MDMWTIALGLVGLVALVGGAELLVRGASSLASRLGVSALVTGLTVVAFGTSAPELAVSVQGASAGHANVALGNVLGSNLFNTLLILGVSALITPLVVAQALVRREVPIMIAASVAALFVALDGRIVMWEGALLFGAFLVYTGYTVVQSRRERSQVVDEYDEAFGAPPRRGKAAVFVELGMVGVGLVLLVLGAGWFVDAAVGLAHAIGLSDLIISLTVVAAGTSLPELATSMVASLRGERDIAVGNVIGSNIFNILVVLGLTAVVAPSGIDVGAGVVGFDLPIVIATAVACLPVFFSGHVIDRWEGAIFVVYYLAYTTYIVLAATQHHALAAFGLIFNAFVLPITALTLGIILYRSLRAEPAEAA